jgi:hypothetical protein
VEKLDVTAGIAMFFTVGGTLWGILTQMPGGTSGEIYRTFSLPAMGVAAVVGLVVAYMRRSPAE